MFGGIDQREIIKEKVEKAKRKEVRSEKILFPVNIFAKINIRIILKEENITGRILTENIFNPLNLMKGIRRYG